MEDIDQRVGNLETRLSAIEGKLGIAKSSVSVATTSDLAAIQKAMSTAVKRNPSTGLGIEKFSRGNFQKITATRLMAWCAGFTFVLAALYFLKLVYDTGWLTPIRQVGIAYFCALSLVTAGFYLEKRDHQYAAYLPAAGLVVLYLTTFMAHLYFHLLPHGAALAMVGVITVFGIWLGRRFDQSAYVIFAAVGVYITPLLVHSPQGELIDLILYYSAWSVLFSYCSIQEHRRITYLLPMYLAMLGFDVVFRLSDSSEWQLSAIYQLVQFLIFGVTTVVYSVVNREPMDYEMALPHGLALFIFYALQYAVLQQHVPELVNYFALASGVFVYALYVIASRLYRGEGSLPTGAVLVSYYCSWVAVHAIFFGEIDQEWLPWAVLCTPVLFLFFARRLAKNLQALTPIMLACGALFCIGYAMLLGDILMESRLHTPHATLALFFYMMLLYAIYYHQSRQPQPAAATELMLYAGHLAFIACLVDWVKHDIYLSALWAIYGVGLLLLAVVIKDKVIGKSALLIFSIAAFKVLLFDLSETNSMLRVLVLLVLSVSLYLGGWLYQSLIQEQQSGI